MVDKRQLPLIYQSNKKTRKVMKTYFKSEGEAKAVLANLTAKFPVVSWDKIGFDKSRNEFMGACFKTVERAEMNEANATFTFIQSYDEHFKKVWRVTFSNL
jgi:hypothetical protein